jgi:hypothetical protein
MGKKQQQGISGNPAKAAAQRSGAEPVPARTPSGSAKAKTSETRSPARARFERASAPAILFLNRLPRWAFPVAMGLLLLAGMLVPSPVVGGLLLVVLVIVLGWLLALSWPLLGMPQRLLRLVVVLGIALVTFGKFTGRFG